MCGGTRDDEEVEKKEFPGYGSGCILTTWLPEERCIAFWYS